MTIDGRLLLLRSVTEAAWRSQVIAWARRDGWRVYFTYRSRRSPAGFPDLVLVRPPRLVIAELKREHGGRFSQDQRDWLTDLGGCPGVEVYAWKPSDEAAVRRVLAA